MNGDQETICRYQPLCLLLKLVKLRIVKGVGGEDRLPSPAVILKTM